MAENSTLVTTVTAIDPDVGQPLSFSISGGEDAALFELRNGNELYFRTAPDYENIPGQGATPGYQVTVQVSDLPWFYSLSSSQAITGGGQRGSPRPPVELI